MPQLRGIFRFVRLLLASFAAAALCSCSCSDPPATPPAAPKRPPETSARKQSPYGPEFWQAWDDGRVEVSTYQLRSRSSESGTATLAFNVTRFSTHTGSEASAGDSGEGILKAMKLTFWKRFTARTELTTALVALEESGGLAAGMAHAVTWTSQSAAGSSWARLAISLSGITATLFRPGEGEIRRSLSYQTGAVPADALPLVARRIAWPRLRLGQKGGGWILTELTAREPLSGYWASTSITQDRHTVVVPAGSFRVHIFRAVVNDQPVRTWYVEAEPPHRIVRWEYSTGEQGALVSSERQPADAPWRRG